MSNQSLMVGQPIHSLQYMLGQLSRYYKSLPFLAVDGMFGEETLEAVMTFQREFCPPVTGTVDQRTWDVLVRTYQEVTQKQARPRQLYGFPDRPFQLSLGDTGDTAALVQVMYRSLSGILERVAQDTTDGICGRQSVENTKWLQHCCQLEENGVLDRACWNMLSRLYDMFIVRRQGTCEK